MNRLTKEEIKAAMEISNINFVYPSEYYRQTISGLLSHIEALEEEIERLKAKNNPLAMCIDELMKTSNFCKGVT